jgi:hypothetical protein
MAPPNKKPIAVKTCSKGHQNGPTAKECWVCGEPLDQPKPQFIQKTQTTVTMAPPVPSNWVDLNIAEEECARYVPGRERCDEKDPSGISCMFLSMGCAIRAKRFKSKTALDVVEG